MPTNTFHLLLPFLPDPSVSTRQITSSSDSNAPLYISECCLLGINFSSSGFSLDDSTHNLHSKLNAFLSKTFQSACSESSPLFLTPPSSSSQKPPVPTLKSKRLNLDRSFEQIDQQSSLPSQSSIEPSPSSANATRKAKPASQNFISLLHQYAQKHQLILSKFDFFVERNMFGCSVEFASKRYTIDPIYSKKLAAKEALCKNILRGLIEENEVEN